MNYLCLLSLIALTFVSCSRGSGGNSGASGIMASPVVNGEVPASQVELQAIQQTLKSNPDYQLTQAEIQALDESKIVSPEDKALLNDIQVK